MTALAVALVILVIFFWVTQGQPALGVIAVGPIALVLVWVLGTMALLGIWFCQISGHAGLGSPHPRNGEGTLLACPDCASTATTRRKGRTALGSRRFCCQACRRRFHERTGTPFNDL